MLGNGVTKYIVSPTTSGAPSWPRRTPVENVQASFSVDTLLVVISGEVAEPRVRVVLRCHQPLAVVGR